MGQLGCPETCGVYRLLCEQSSRDLSASHREKEVKMRRIMGVLVTLLFLGSCLAIAVSSYPLEAGSQGKSLEAVLEEIRADQSIGGREPIDCAKVTDEQFEALGEAFMSIMHPDPEEHEIMDRMMGGEGSSILRTTHRIMGARYLGCYTGGVPADVTGMMMGGMGPGMMGRGMIWDSDSRARWEGRGHVMDFGYGWGMMDNWYGGALMWIVILVILGVVVYLAVKHGTGKVPVGPSGESALDTLKRRYARGEISKEEFDQMKKDLQ